jgi:hypothetical protein
MGENHDRDSILSFPDQAEHFKAAVPERSGLLGLARRA